MTNGNEWAMAKKIFHNRYNVACGKDSLTSRAKMKMRHRPDRIQDKSKILITELDKWLCHLTINNTVVTQGLFVNGRQHQNQEITLDA